MNVSNLSCVRMFTMLKCDIDYHTQIWVCQQALQKEVSRRWSEHHNLPSSHVLIMQFQIGFPGVEFYNDYDEQVA